MDPYLEHPAHWPDFHARFINYWCETLMEILPAPYTARIGERLYLIEASPDTRRLVVPDVAVERGPGSSMKTHPRSAGTATLEPVIVPLSLLEEARETHVEILHRSDRTLVAVLELLSPTNKTEPGRSDYLARRNALLRQPVHLLELDLLLGGKRLPFGQTLPEGDYFAFLARAERRLDCEVYAWPLAQTLPPLPVPLRPPDPDVWVELGSLLDLVYERGAYQGEVDYSRPPPFPVAAETQAWIAECLRNRAS
jgi:hypothetical protein